MLYRSNTIYMCPNNSNTNNILTNENSERIPPISTPLIEMGFSPRLVQRAINTIGMHYVFVEFNEYHFSIFLYVFKN